MSWWLEHKDREGFTEACWKQWDHHMKSSRDAGKIPMYFPHVENMSWKKAQQHVRRGYSPEEIDIV